MSRLGSLLLSLGSLCWALPGTAQTAPSKWLSYDPATKTVTFALEAGAPGTAGPFNFNGYANGAATLVVPASSTVVLNFVNMDGTPHSAQVIADKDPMPNAGGDPAIPAAYTKDVTQGLPQGGKDVIRFTAPRVAASGSSAAFPGMDCPACGSGSRWIRRPSRPTG